MYSSALVTKQQYMSAILPIIVFVLFTFASIQGYREKLFPYVRVEMRQRPKRTIGVCEVETVVGFLASIATIIQFFLDLVTKTQ